MSMSSKIAIVLGLVAGLSTAALAYEGSLHLPGTSNANVELTLDSELSDNDPSEFLKIFVGGVVACCTGKTPIAGSYEVNGRTLTFDPAFGFIEGQRYTVMVRSGDVANAVSSELTEFTIEQTSSVASPEVLAIYPSSDTIPENSLRFYIHFSSPMRPHMSTRYIRLVDSNGKEDTAAFMSFKQELWSTDRKRLTLLMDPGRIKRGVAQNLTLGPALLAGNDYSIVIEDGWQNANGTQTAPRFEKQFKVSGALRTLPQVKPWQIEPLRARTLDPLVIVFDRPFDHELAQSSITVLDEYGESIEGDVSMINNEKGWRFDPHSQWTTAKILIVIDPLLEDVAGNNFKELLDHPVDSESHSTVQDGIVLEHTPL